VLAPSQLLQREAGLEVVVAPQWSDLDLLPRCG
jgi:hypothetical protein